MRSSGVFPSGVPGKRLLLAGVEVNATLLDPKTPQDLENRRKASGLPPESPILLTSFAFGPNFGAANGYLHHQQTFFLCGDNHYFRPELIFFLLQAAPVH